MKEFKTKTYKVDQQQYWKDYEYWQVKEKLKIWREVKWSSWWNNKYCIATLSANQSINNASWTTITFNTFSTNDTWMSVTYNRVTITKQWLYSIIWVLTYAHNATWTREIILRKNGSIVWNLTFLTNSVSWAYTSVQINQLMFLNVWDYIEIRAYQTSWWALNIIWQADKTYLHIWEM